LPDDRDERGLRLVGETTPSGQGAPLLHDAENPKALVNVVRPEIREKIARVPADLFSLTEDELEKRSPKGQFTWVDRRLRVSWWQEYTRATENHPRMMKMTEVVKGICSRNYFYEHVLADKVRLAFLLTPPSNYEVATEEALLRGVDRIREILDFPLYDEQGRPQPKNAEVMIKAYMLLDQRVKGAVIQRIEQKNLNLNVGKPQNSNDALTDEEAERKLTELMEIAARGRSSLPQPQTIEVESTVENPASPGDKDESQ
jgi:hypothetical protein